MEKGTRVGPREDNGDVANAELMKGRVWVCLMSVVYGVECVGWRPGGKEPKWDPVYGCPLPCMPRQAPSTSSSTLSAVAFVAYGWRMAYNRDRAWAAAAGAEEDREIEESSSVGRGVINECVPSMRALWIIGSTAFLWML